MVAERCKARFRSPESGGWQEVRGTGIAGIVPLGQSRTFFLAHRSRAVERLGWTDL